MRIYSVWAVALLLLEAIVSASSGFLVPDVRRAKAGVFRHVSPLKERIVCSAEPTTPPAPRRRQYTTRTTTLQRSRRARYGGGLATQDEYMEATRWGRLSSPLLFEMFDPSKPADNKTVIEQRTEGLGKAKNERMLTSILGSWAKAARAPDAAERCYEVLCHIRKHRTHLRANVFIYGVVINAYARRNQAAKAEELLREMLKERGVRPVVHTFNKVMNAWAKSTAADAPERCEELLVEMKELPFNRRFPRLEPDAVTFTTLIDAYARRGRAKEAEEVFLEMVDMRGVKPDSFAVASVMNAWCWSDVEDAPEQCRRVLSLMTDLACSTNNKEIFPKVPTYNAVVDMFARVGRASEAEEVFRTMLHARNVEPDVRTFNIVLKAWAKSNSIDAPERCQRLLDDFSRMASMQGRTELAPDTVSYNTVIGAFAGRGRAEEAEEVLRGMLNATQVKPNVRSFATVMNAWSKSNAADAPEHCNRLLSEMMELASSTYSKDLAPNAVTYTTVIDAYARRGRASEAEKVLRDMLSSQVELNARSFATVMTAWSNSKSEEAAEQCRRLLHEMTEMASSTGNKNLTPDVVTFTTVIDEFAKRGLPQEAEEVFREMLSAVDPNIRSFSAVMKAWSKSSADDAPEQCQRLLKALKELAVATGKKNLNPNSIVYCILIDAYARRGRAKEAEAVFREMLSVPGVEPNVYTFTSVINAWSKTRADDAADNCKRLLAEMVELASSKGSKGFALNNVAYTLVIDAHARRGEAIEAEGVLQLMLNTPGIDPDAHSFSGAIKAWSKSDADDAPEQCKRLLADMTKLADLTGRRKLAPDTLVYNTVIDAYARRGRFKEAQEVFEEMLNAPGVEPDVCSFSSLMDAWNKSEADDAPERCRQILEEMIHKYQLPPDPLVVVTLRRAYSYRGRGNEVDEILRKTLSDLEERGLSV